MKWTAAGKISSPVGSIWGKTGEGEGRKRNEENVYICRFIESI